MSSEDRLRAAIDLPATTVRPGGELVYLIKNLGSVALTCGLPYRLERESGDGWVTMNPGMAFSLIAFGVGPGDSRELRTRIPTYAPAGSYRISTAVRSDDIRGTVHLSAHFDVVDDI